MEDFKQQENEQEIQQSQIQVQNSAIQTIWNNDKMRKDAYSAAKFISASDLVPQTYKNRPENCLIAIDIANNTGLTPLTVMQNLYIVQGKPAWSGQMCIALVNNSRRYLKPLEFIFVGNKEDGSYGCFAATVNFEGKTIQGTTVTMQMAQDEGWLNKSGSKWKTMPEQMLQYRAGAFFARIHCPDLLLGLPTVDEVKDTYGYEEDDKQKTVITFTEDIISGQQ